MLKIKLSCFLKINFLICLFILLSNFIINCSNFSIIEVTKENIDTILIDTKTEGQSQLILFYDSSIICRDCRKWEEYLTKTLEHLKEDSTSQNLEKSQIAKLINKKVKFIKIDGFRYFEKLNDYEIDTLPTLKFIYNYYNISKDLTKEFSVLSNTVSINLINYLTTKVANIIITISSEKELNQYNSKNAVNLVFGDTKAVRNNYKYNYTEIITEVVKSFDEVSNVLYVDLDLKGSSKNVTNLLNYINFDRKDLETKPILMLYKKYDDNSVDFFKYFPELNRDNLSLFLKIFAKPLVSYLNLDDVSNIFNCKNKKNFFIFVDKAEKNSHNYKRFKDSNSSNESISFDSSYTLFYKYGLTNRKNLIDNNFFLINNLDEPGKIIYDMFDIQEHEYPLIVSVKFSEDDGNCNFSKFKIIEENMAETSINDFIISKSEKDEFFISESNRSIKTKEKMTKLKSEGIEYLVGENFENEISQSDCFLIFTILGDKIDENILKLLKNINKKIQKIREKSEISEISENSNPLTRTGIIDLTYNEIKRNLDPFNLYFYHRKSNDFDLFNTTVSDISLKNLFKFMDEHNLSSDCLGKQNSEKLQENYFSKEDEEILYNKSFYFEEIYENLEYKVGFETFSEQLSNLKKLSYGNNYINPKSKDSTSNEDVKDISKNKLDETKKTDL